MCPESALLGPDGLLLPNPVSETGCQDLGLRWWLPSEWPGLLGWLGHSGRATVLSAECDRGKGDGGAGCACGVHELCPVQ
jgi:hypothetical protein